MVKRLVAWALVLLVVLRAGGIIARQVRNSHLDYYLQTGVDALERDGFVVFLDWSSLLGMWREAGFLADEEDCDLGVIVPDHLTEASVAATMQAAFQPGDFMKIIAEPGAIFAEPRFNRLHLDLYLVRQNGTQLHPMWPPPDRIDSHAAFIYPRPFSGVSRLQGYPVPANTEEYLGSLFGYLGHGGAYNSTSGLYDNKAKPADAGAVVGMWAWLSGMGYTLTRDFYFVMLMIPLSQEFRKAVEERFAGIQERVVSYMCNGKSGTVSMRDC
eukprot:TRINITY_DN26951_c0_g1_i1.p1 TRINITY_DN26951_c0_g1~~TRINITY_DN26951_c0_g1_i1.p1  ORF type:complete len:270 (-),score=46.71 TRINITY_DN26951_c0_g1_i1:288-1097(-)